MNALTLPNLIIAGAGKCGTTSLFWYLAQHPDITASAVKEIGYFAPLATGSPTRPLEEYAAYFRHAREERYRLEASPGYLYGGGAVVTGISQTLTEPKIIVSLRDPAARVFPSYRYLRSRMALDPKMSFAAYVEHCLRLREAGVDHEPRHRPYWTVSAGFYATHLERWLQAFGNSLRVVFFEDLAADPKAVVQRLCSWLQLDTDVTDTFRYTVQNRTVLPRNRALQRGALALNRTALVSRHPRLKAPFRAAYYAVNGSTVADGADAATLARLRALYAPANEDLAELLRRYGYTDLPTWLGQPTVGATARGSEADA